MNGRVGVLGGCGYIGSRLCRALAEAGYDVRAIDRERSIQLDGAPSGARIEIAEGDLARVADFDRLMDGVDTIVDLAYTTVPGTSMHDPARDVLTNVATAAAWLSRLGTTGVRRVMNVSSGGTVYGIPQYLPIDEDHPTNPICSYGITKLAIEKYTAMYAAMSDVDHVIVRPSNVFGPGQRTEGGQGLVATVVDRAIRGEMVEVWGSGSSVRDYLFVDDAVAAIAALVAYRGPLRVFNVATGTGRSVDDVIRSVETAIGDRVRVRRVPARGFDVPENVLCTSRIADETGWRPRTEFDAGVERVAEYATQRRSR